MFNNYLGSKSRCMRDGRCTGHWRMARVYISGEADEITFPKPRHLLFFPFFFWLPFLPCHSRALFLLPFVRLPCFNIHSCLIVRYTVTSLKKKKKKILLVLIYLHFGPAFIAYSGFCLCSTFPALSSFVCLFVFSFFLSCFLFHWRS